MAIQSPRPALRALQAIEVFAPARLHLGFLDLNGGLGRRFGSIGLTIDGIGTRLTLARSQAPAAANAPREARLARSIADRLGIAGGVAVTVDEAIPEHLGLGSRTPLAPAIASGLARLAGRGPDAPPPP